MTSEQGSLYEIGVDTPPTPGNLFIITLEGCGQVGSGGDVVITVSENVLRGGIVMEDAGAPSAVVLNGTTVNIGECQIPPPVCPGDICDSSTMGPPDGTVDSGDFYKIYGEILNQYPGFVDPTYKYDIGMPAGYENADICDSTTMGPPDGTVDSGDFYKIYGEILNQYPGFVDPTYKYDIGCPF
jgi:hypothetical protein